MAVHANYSWRYGCGFALTAMQLAQASVAYHLMEFSVSTTCKVTCVSL
jgi:hypothetical protein